VPIIGGGNPFFVSRRVRCFLGSLRVILPEPDEEGTAVVKVVAVAVVTAPWVTLKASLLSAAEVAELVPVIVTAEPTTPIVGVTLVIVGAAVVLLVITVKDVLLVAEPLGVVTAIGPVVAPLGTITNSWMAVAEVTVAGVPLNVTVF